jgi:hypothetical protein
MWLVVRGHLDVSWMVLCLFHFLAGQVCADFSEIGCRAMRIAGAVY